MELLLEQKVDMPVGWKRIPLGAVIETKPGNNKLIKGKQFDEPGPSRYPGFSATGQDIYCAVAEYDRDGIVLSAVGARCGKCFMATGKWTAVANTHVLLPKLDEVDTKFIWYLLNDENFWVKSGTAQPFVAVKKSMEIEVALPPIPQQRRIVEAIELQLGRLDAAVARLQGAKARLKRYKQAVLKAAFADGEPTRLEELCEFITKGTTPPKPMLSDEGTVPFIKVYNLTRDGSLDFTIDPTFVTSEVHNGFLARSICYPGDVLMNIVGPPLGKVSLVPDDYPEWNINQAIARYRTKDVLRAKYLMYYLLCESTAQELMATTKATAGQFNLTLAHCRDLTIPLVPVQQQDIVIAHLEDKLGTIDQTETTLDAQLQQAVRLRQAVLKRAFKGRLL